MEEVGAAAASQATLSFTVCIECYDKGMEGAHTRARSNVGSLVEKTWSTAR